jgi:hypothetical protein
MFRHAPVAEAAEIEQGGDRGRNADLIPLTVLKLDLDPGEPWHSFLGRRGIRFVPDHIGRDAISAGDAQRLLDEKREDLLRQAALRRTQEAEAIADDQRRRAQIWKGLPAVDLPVGVSASDAMVAAAKDAQPRRESVLQHALANTGEMEYHSYQATPEGAA